jgi:NAD(P)-dependent dehydrogenase (short-subunit alcohol dehydrogenase family)
MTDVLITGASRGIGLGFAREYAARGAHVYAAVRNPDSMPALDGRYTVIKLDVTSTVDIVAAAGAVTDGLDVLINNAGIGHTTKGLAEVDGDRMAEILRVNTIAPLLVAQQLGPLLRQGGRLVNITMPSRPIAQVRTATDNHAFIASRYAHNALTKMVSIEWANSGRIVVALWPGFIRTDLNDNHPDGTPPEEAMPGVVDLIERLGPDDHGQCLMPDGQHYDW